MSKHIILLFMFLCCMDSYLYIMQIIDLRGNRPQDKQNKLKIDVHYNFFAFSGLYRLKPVSRKFPQLALDTIESFSLLESVDPALIKYSFS